MERNQNVNESTWDIPYAEKHKTQFVLCVPPLVKCSWMSSELLQTNGSSQEITIIR